MMAPTMTTDAKPALPADLARDLALAEVLAVRLESQITLVALASDADSSVGIGDFAADYPLDHAMALARRLKEKLQAAIAGLDGQIADVDLTEAEIEGDEGEDS